MTKKSSARLARDAKEQHIKEQLKDNTCWDDVQKIHDDCKNLLEKHTYILQHSRNKELVAAIDDKALVIRLINSLAADLVTLQTELKQISDQHTGKSGGTQDPDELVFSITIWEQYQLFLTRHDAICMPTAVQIAEIFDKAANKLEIIKLGQELQRAQNLTEEELAELAQQQEITRQIEEAAAAQSVEAITEVSYTETQPIAPVEAVDQVNTTQG